MSKSRIAKRLLGSLGLGAILAASLPVAAFAAIAVDGGSTNLFVNEGITVVDAVSVTTAIIGGDDEALFSIVGGNLVFDTEPDFENPSDFGLNNTYKVTLEDGANTEAITISVDNINEAPTFSQYTHQAHVFIPNH